MRPSILVPALCLLLAVLPAGASAQFVLRGQVMDARGDLPLVGAHVRIEDGSAGATTDGLGRFELACPSKRVAVRVTYVGFLDVRKRVDASAVEASGLLIRMEPVAIQLPEIPIRSSGPEVVFERKDLHVGEYLASQHGLWVLVYERPQLWHDQAHAGQQVLRGARLHLLDTLFREIASTALPAAAHELHRDLAGRPVIEGAMHAWIAEPGGEGITLSELDLVTLRDAVLPWTDSINGMLLGNNCVPTFPAFDHFARDLSTGTDRVFCSVMDPFTMELFRSQYKYMRGSDKVIAMDLALELGVDPEVVAGYMTDFPSDPYFHLPYAPLFVVNDTLCVFDHCAERIKRFDLGLRQADDVPITHQRDPEWKGGVLQDRRSGAVYAYFRKGPFAYLRSIDTRTGALGTATRLTHAYPDDVQVHDGHAYYVYREFGSLQKRALYSEALR